MSLIKGNHGGLGGAGAPGGALGSFYSHTIDQSLRFEDGDSAKLYFDPTSDGDKQKFTWSGWVKRGNLGLDYAVLFSGMNSSGHQTDIRFEGEDTLRLITATSSLEMNVTTDRVFRDTSSWYHIVVAIDTTQSTLTDRFKVYVNGVQETSFSSTTCAQNHNCVINTASNTTHNVGANGYTTSVSSEFDGYLAEINFIDGAQYDASYFGETKDGVWIPKEYSGSYGTNGFHLPFGQDTSSGSSFFFDRSSASQVTFTNSSYYDIGSSDDFTLEAFIRPTSTMMSNYCFLLGYYGGPSGPYMMLQFSPSSNLFYFYTGNGAGYQFNYTAGDVVAGQWHHIAINRASGSLRFFLDGTQKGSTLTSNTQAWDNSQFDINLAGSSSSYQSSTYSFDGEISNVRFVVGSAVYSDGASITVPTATLTNVTNTKLLALTTSTFTQDASSNNVTGTVTGSGYFASSLSPFANFNFYSDISGNTNNFAATNLQTSDVVLDSPTNNFPVLLPGFTQTTQEGGLKLKRSSSGNIHTGCFSTMGVSSGKWYVEIKYEDSSVDTVTFGVAETKGGFDATVDGTAYVETSGISSATHMEFATWSVEAKLSSSYAGTLGSAGSYGSSPSSGDIIQIALDMDDKKIWYGVNGTYIASGDPANGTNASQSGSAFNPTGEVVFVASAYMGRDFSISFNFGQDSANVSSANTDENGIGTFEYAPPSGFLALCSANLPDITIGPGQSSQADDNFNTVLYTGDGSNGQAITGVGFQPDWLWIKSRSGTAYHELHDSVRGAGKRLFSNDTTAEGDVGTVSSFDSDGFTVSRNSAYDGTNQNTVTFVGWSWKAGGSASSNSNGSITSSVSANTDAGFSICTYTGTSTVSESFGHGLNQAPELVITKARNTTDAWRAHGSILGTNKFLALSGTNAVATDSSNGGFPDNTDTLVNLGYESTNGTNYVAYCFHSVDGFSKVGSYTGNNSTDGPFSYTGFRPAWLLLKRTDSAASWLIYDNKRDTFNQMQFPLFPNLSNAEYTSNLLHVDFLSNGFKIRNATYGETNASGGTYIFLAFAEQPFKFANAR
jgi:hypothetical protein